MVKRIEAAPSGAPGPALEDLAQQADNLGGAGDDQGSASGAPPEADQAGPVVTNATLIAGILETIREGFCMTTKLQSPRVTFTHDHATQLGEVWGQVCDKRGIDLKQWLGDWALEMAALALSVQVLGEVRAAVRAEISQRKAAAAAAAGQAGQGGAAAGDEGQGQA